MKSDEKKEIVKILVTESNPKTRFNLLVAVTMKSGLTTPSQKRYFNAAGFSKVNLDTLEYDLKKLYGITKTELATADIPVVGEVVEAKVLPQDLLDELVALDLEAANYNTELKPMAKKVSEALEEKIESQKKADLIAYLTAKKETAAPAPTEDEGLEKWNELLAMFSDASIEVKEGLSLREEFPFLGKEDCPDEFKILVADKLTAYEKFLEARAEMKDALGSNFNADELFEIAKKAVENFELNKEIYAELDYYKEHGTILGEHKIFAEKVLEQTVNAYSTVELTKRQKNLRSYISRDSKKLDKMDEGEDKNAFAAKISEWEKELALIDARIEKIS